VPADAGAVCAHHADAVRLIDHQQGAVAVLDVDDRRQVGDVAVHAVHTLDDYQAAAVQRAVPAEYGVQRRGLVVREGPAGGP